MKENINYIKVIITKTDVYLAYHFWTYKSSKNTMH